VTSDFDHGCHNAASRNQSLITLDSHCRGRGENFSSFSLLRDLCASARVLPVLNPRDPWHDFALDNTTTASGKAGLAICDYVGLTTNSGVTNITYSTNIVTEGGSLVVVDGTNIVAIPTNTIFGNQPSTSPHDEVSNSNGTVLSYSDVGIYDMFVNIPNQWNFNASGFGTTTRENITIGKGKAAVTGSIYPGAYNYFGYGTMGSNTPIVVNGKLTSTFLKVLIQ
jgi:hypothetical protein